MAFVGRGFVLSYGFELLASAGGHLAHSLTLKDAKPHHGVAAAHNMPIQGIDVSQCEVRHRLGPSACGRRQVRLHEGDAGRDHLDPKFLDNCHAAEARRRRAWRLSLRLSPLPGEPRVCGLCERAADSDAPPPVLDLELEQPLQDLSRQGGPGARAREDQDHARRHGDAYRQAADHLYRPQISPRDSGRRVHRLSFRLRSVAAEPQDIYGARNWASGSSPPRHARLAARSIATAYNGTCADWDRVLKWLQAGR